jgi:ParB-like chromosome segregation protein Spo0J
MTSALQGLRLSLVHYDDQCQTREALSQEHIADLVAALDGGATMPPLDVVELPDGSLCVVDGFHRLAAYQTFGSTYAPMRVVAEGTIDDARRIALGANAEPRGLRRSNADKRRAVTLALSHPEAPRWSDTKIAELCQVDRATVLRAREAISAPSPIAEERREATSRAASAALANPAASIRQIAKAADVSKATAAKAIEAAKAPSVPQERPEPPAAPTPPKPPTAAMVAKAAALPANAPDPLPLLEALRQMDALRRFIGPLIGKGEIYRSSTQDFDHGWDRARACIAFAVPVPCAHHEGPDCQWCGGDGWYSTDRSKAVESQHGAMMSIRGKR